MSTERNYSREVSTLSEDLDARFLTKEVPSSRHSN